MAKTRVSEWSTTPSSNTDIDGINIAEGCAPSGINDAIRDMMAQIRSWQSGTYGDTFNGPVNGTVGATTPATGAFTTLSASSTVTLSGGTANGVTYLNGSKVLTSGSALTFDGTTFRNTAGGAAFSGVVGAGISASVNGRLRAFNSTNDRFIEIYNDSTTSIINSTYGSAGATPLVFQITDSEQMRLTSTGLGIGTSSPSFPLDISAAAPRIRQVATTGTNSVLMQLVNTGGTAYVGLDNSSGGLGGAYSLNIFHGGAYPIVFSTSGTERMRLDSSGNLGLGVTPSAWASSVKALELPTGAFYSYASGSVSNFYNLTNAYLNSAGNSIYKQSSYATQYVQSAGQHTWYTAPSGTAGNAITFTQAMTLDASGALAIGSTSASASKLRVTVGGSAAGVRVDGITGSNQDFYALRNGASTIQDGPNITLQSASGTTYATSMQMGPTGETLFFNFNGSAWNERARIDSSGNLLRGQTSSGNLNGRGFYSDVAGYFGQNHLSGDASGSAYAYFGYNGSSIGTITQSGTTAVAYNTSSDYRLKNTIAPMTGALAKVALLKPCTYKWNVDGSDGEGFIAHELAEVVPQCVTGEKDAVDEEGNPKYQGIDVSFLVATLTAAIQELNAKFEAYKASHP